jgi:hypothetical protein
MRAVMRLQVSARLVGNRAKLALWTSVAIGVAIRDLIALGQSSQRCVGLRDQGQQLQSLLARTAACMLQLV